MTQEQKARAYDEALAWMRELYPGLHGATKQEAEHYFPEIRESDDERIRKMLINRVRSAEELTDELREWILDYLEKQKEQNPIKQGCKGRRGRRGDIPKDIRKRAEAFLAKMEPPYDTDDICTAYETGSIEQKPVEWSEEDKAIVGCIACCLDGQFVTDVARKQSLEWFNKHRRDFLNCPSWKPSEEQMKALLKAEKFLNAHSQYGSAKRISEIYKHFEESM